MGLRTIHVSPGCQCVNARDRLKAECIPNCTHGTIYIQQGANTFLKKECVCTDFIGIQQYRDILTRRKWNNT